jgi:hypothetical protein
VPARRRKANHLWNLGALFVVMAASRACQQQPEDTLVQLNTLPACTSEAGDVATFVAQHQFGISVENLHHHNIFRYDSKKAPWRPITGYRATVCGRLENYYISDGHDDQDEYDWNIDVVPDPPFSPSMGAEAIEGEVTPATTLRTNPYFPPKGRERESPRIGKAICLYGPWVRDLGNDAHREIHPSEAIWWQNTEGKNLDLQLIFLQDAAIHRFTENADYDFDEDHDGTNDYYAGWAPWVQYPQTERVDVPFEYDPKTAVYRVITIGETQSSSVVTALDPELADSDNGNVHKLKAKSRFDFMSYFSQTTIVEVHEGASAGPNVGVQFSGLCTATGGVVRGNVRVLTALGHVNTRAAGYQVLRFTSSTAVNGNPPLSTQ